ncbi:MAG: ABC transporter permease [Eubacteriales bacterium]|nr:ABC transporter permease [Eubacteriales bacterium]
MRKYIINRLLWMIVIVIATAFLIFSILYFTPGDPARYLLGTTASEADIAAKHEQMGLNDPYLVQLGRYMYDTFIRFDFGTSWVFEVPVYSELASRLPRTLIIGLFAMVLNVIVGLSLGIFAGTHSGKWQDSLTMAIAMVFVSCPDFWVALMMILLFTARLGWLPAYGIDSWKCYIMPIIASSLGGVANNARQTRSSILEVFRADYITTARAKGQVEKKVVLHHMLPNALMPIITSLGTGLSRIVAGSAVIEAVFSIPGVGQYMLTSVNYRDYPAVRACVLFFAVFAAIVMLLVDLVYAFVDPRIKAKYDSGRK